MRSWTSEQIEFLRDNYNSMTSQQLSVAIGRSYCSVYGKLNDLGLKRADSTTDGVKGRSGVKSMFSEVENEFLRNNCGRLTNRQLADQLNRKLTVVRNQIYLLGLKRNNRPRTWTEAETNFLVDNYQKMGDVDIGIRMTELFPDSPREFSRRSIGKKRKLMLLKRTAEQIKAITSTEEFKARINTIAQNSGSARMSDGWIAQILATRKHPERRKIYLKHPELLRLKRAQIQLNRELKSKGQ